VKESEKTMIDDLCWSLEAVTHLLIPLELNGYCQIKVNFTFYCTTVTLYTGMLWCSSHMHSLQGVHEANHFTASKYTGKHVQSLGY